MPIHDLYDGLMQIAVVLPDEQVDELDRLVPGQFASRAEAVRVAVAAMLVARRAAAIDQRYEAAYAEKPPQVDNLDSGRVRKGQTSTLGVWDDLDW